MKVTNFILAIIIVVVGAFGIYNNNAQSKRINELEKKQAQMEVNYFNLQTQIDDLEEDELKKISSVATQSKYDISLLRSHFEQAVNMESVRWHRQYIYGVRKAVEALDRGDQEMARILAIQAFSNVASPGCYNNQEIIYEMEPTVMRLASLVEPYYTLALGKETKEYTVLHVIGNGSWGC